MTLTREIIAVLSNLGVFQGLFLAMYLMRLKKGDHIANILLACLVLALTIRVGKSVLNHYLVLVPWARNIGLSAFLSVGPLLFLYGKKILQDYRLQTLDLVHFIPSFIFAACAFIIPNQSNLLSYLSYSLVLLQLFLYVAFSWVNAKANSQLTDHYLWYKKLVVGVFLVGILFLLIFVRIIPFYIAGAMIYSLLIYYFSYSLLKKHSFQLGKYQQSKLKRDESDKLLEKLEELLASEKLHCQSRIKLEDLALRLATTSRNLSQTINQNKNKNFSEYINEWRIQEIKNMLSDTSKKDQKIATLAFACGFNNLTSFNQLFRLKTGFTPSQYRKHFLIKES